MSEVSKPYAVKLLLISFLVIGMLNQDFSNTLALINTNQITHCHFE